MPRNNQQDTDKNRQRTNDKETHSSAQPKQEGNSRKKAQSVPLGVQGQELLKELDKQIAQFEQQLQSKSNSELKEISERLELVERAMLLKKIDNELNTMKETVVKPGDAASATTAAASAATAVEVPNQPTTS